MPFLPETTDSVNIPVDTRQECDCKNNRSVVHRFEFRHVSCFYSNCYGDCVVCVFIMTNTNTPNVVVSPFCSENTPNVVISPLRSENTRTKKM